MVAANCHICMAIKPVDKFRILPCGHGYCEGCIPHIQPLERAPTKIHCPHCRTRVTKASITPGIYLDFVDSKTAVVANVVEGMGKMDENAPLASVKKARDKLEKAAKSCRGDDDLTSQLLRSIEDFTTRIIPLFEEFHNQRQELEQARKQNEKLQNEKAELGKRLAKSQWYHSENERLRNEVIQAQRIADEATVAGEKLKDLLTETRNDLASYKKIAADLDKDKKRMADQLERNSNAAKNSREKVKDVRAQNAELQKKIESLEQRLLETPHSPVSQPQPHDYDGDFSSHELKTPSRYLVKSSQPPPPPPLPEDIDFFEGMPRPGFGSDWQLNRGKENCSVLKKTRPVGGPTHRRVTNPVGLMALSLDRKGKPTTAVQLGPKRTVRI